MKKINRILFVLIFALLPLIAVAAAETGAEIVYFEDPRGDIAITSPGGEAVDTDFGVILTEGTKIETGGGILELRLVPNGTILKLSSGTSFELRALQSEGGSKENIFALLRGKLRTLAARAGRGERYQIQTPSAVCAIRGTEIINEVGDSGSSIIVRHGSVYVESVTGKRWVTLEANQGLDTRSSDYRPVTIPIEEIEAIFADFPFLGADPSAVPGAPPITGDGSGAVPIGSAAGAIGQPVTEAVARDREYDTRSYDERSKFGRWMSDSLGGEIGTTTIDGDTYSKLVLSPVIDADKFRMALYLPIIYVDLFDGGTWYKPRGNNEWSFGTDQSGWQDVISDVWMDLWLKIRYVEYGDAEWDPLYIKLGNLNTMSMGHGALVYQYANDYDFPAIRRIGFNMGYESTVGFEVMADDLSRPNLMGLRFSVSPFKSYRAFEMGLSGVVDIKPAGEAADPDYYGDPWFLAASLDLDFLEVNTGLLKLVWFADGSTMAPMYRSDADTGDFPNVKAGPAWDMLWDDGRPTNFGLRSGLRGLLGPVRYSLEYRYWNGVYVPSMFNSLYGRKKVEYVDTFTNYLNNETVLSDNMGIFGEAYWDILDNGRLSIGAGYHWPWSIGNGAVDFDTADYLKLELVVGRKLIKAYGVHGSLKFERSNVRQTISDPDSYSWFDAYTVFSGEIVFPLNPLISLAIVGGTATKYDANGNIVWSNPPDNTIPEITPVLNIETRINY